MARLQALHLRFAADPGSNSTGRRQTRNAYDHLLVQVADLLEIPGAPAPDLVIGRRVLTVLERSLLEKAVAAAGVDLGLDGRPKLRAIGTGAPLAPSSPSRPAAPWPPASGTAPWSGTSAGTTATERPTGRWPSPVAPPPPPPAAPVQTRRAGLAREARGMRRRLDAYERDDRLWPTKVDEWCEDLDTYDGVLIDLSEVVGLPASSRPAGDRRRLLSEERESLEAGLAEAGLDLGAPGRASPPR